MRASPALSSPSIYSRKTQSFGHSTYLPTSLYLSSRYYIENKARASNPSHFAPTLRSIQLHSDCTPSVWQPYSCIQSFHEKEPAHLTRPHAIPGLAKPAAKFQTINLPGRTREYGYRLKNSGFECFQSISVMIDTAIPASSPG